ncbi:hypothetical protein GO730_06675 [Spirosoma sp. HMF3257]|uniref:Uncharacterized protein n=1 Tax=Spirosoma telluris TaxID=2183553 RepID=A0A327NFL0_9BACT|nr:hypothetical protein [Spirosoma telluris]RAI74101.1 hypothetical protein HMF3257_06615 [Spirosoma telluris]
MEKGYFAFERIGWVKIAFLASVPFNPFPAFFCSFPAGAKKKPQNGAKRDQNFGELVGSNADTLL